MAIEKIHLDNGSFITYEGVAEDGHWNPGGWSEEGAKNSLDCFRNARPTTGGIRSTIHQQIVVLQEAQLYMDPKAYSDSGYYPHLAWLALDRSGIIDALDNLGIDDDSVQFPGLKQSSGITIGLGDFQLAAEMAAQLPRHEINWDNRTDGCGGHNLLFLYTDDIVSKLYPDYIKLKPDGRPAMYMESFLFNPSLVQTQQ